MSRFDDELRHALRPLAHEPLSDDILDDALDALPARPRWPSMAAVIVAGLLVVTMAGIGLGQVLPDPPLPPSPSELATAMPSDAPDAACDDVAAPAGGDDIVLVFFPCGSGTVEMVSTARSVPAGLNAEPRLEAALRALLEGPSALELSMGLEGVVPAGSEELLSGVTVRPDGLAQVDFDPALDEIGNLNTSARGGRFVQALRETALQFDEVTALELRLAGSCENLFTFLGSTCRHLAKPIGQVGYCPLIEPLDLPSGAPLTEPRPHPTDPAVSWGSGSDTVTVSATSERSGHPFGGYGEPVSIRGQDGYVLGPLDEQSQAVLTWWEDGDVIFGTSERADCMYVARIGPGLTHKEAIAFASRFGSVVAQPAETPPPDEPVSASVEELGIRLTITLERNSTAFGERVIGVATIENIGSESVFWGHSSTCAFPASITARPDSAAPIPFGRDDWPGEDAILKRVTVDDRISGAEIQFGFQPDEWLDFEGNLGCTSDLVTSELRQGSALTQRLGWDTVGYYGMPPPTGDYSVEGSFAFMSRGEPPGFDEDVAIDEFLVTASLAFAVDGPAVDYISPGEAVDAILGDEAFRALLLEAPRARWLQSDVAFADGNWVMSLYLTASDREVEPTEAIVASVDAISAAVLMVEVDEGARPPGS